MASTPPPALPPADSALSYTSASLPLIEVCPSPASEDVDEVRASLARGEQPLSFDLLPAGTAAVRRIGPHMQLKVITMRLADWTLVQTSGPARVAELLAGLTCCLYPGASSPESLLTDLNTNILGTSSRVARGTFDLGNRIICGHVLAANEDTLRPTPFTARVAEFHTVLGDLSGAVNNAIHSPAFADAMCHRKLFHNSPLAGSNILSNFWHSSYELGLDDSPCPPRQSSADDFVDCTERVDCPLSYSMHVFCAPPSSPSPPGGHFLLLPDLGYYIPLEDGQITVFHAPEPFIYFGPRTSSGYEHQPVHIVGRAIDGIVNGSLLRSTGRASSSTSSSLMESALPAFGSEQNFTTWALIEHLDILKASAESLERLSTCGGLGALVSGVLASSAESALSSLPVDVRRIVAERHVHGTTRLPVLCLPLDGVLASFALPTSAHIDATHTAASSTDESAVAVGARGSLATPHLTPRKRTRFQIPDIDSDNDDDILGSPLFSHTPRLPPPHHARAHTPTPPSSAGEQPAAQRRRLAKDPAYTPATPLSPADRAARQAASAEALRKPYIDNFKDYCSEVSIVRDMNSLVRGHSSACTTPGLVVEAMRALNQFPSSDDMSNRDSRQWLDIVNTIGKAVHKLNMGYEQLGLLERQWQASTFEAIHEVVTKVDQRLPTSLFESTADASLPRDSPTSKVREKINAAFEFYYSLPPRRRETPHELVFDMKEIFGSDHDDNIHTDLTLSNSPSRILVGTATPDSLEAKQACVWRQVASACLVKPISNFVNQVAPPHGAGGDGLLISSDTPRRKARSLSQKRTMVRDRTCDPRLDSSSAKLKSQVYLLADLCRAISNRAVGERASPPSFLLIRPLLQVAFSHSPKALREADRKAIVSTIVSSPETQAILDTLNRCAIALRARMPLGMFPPSRMTPFVSDFPRLCQVPDANELLVQPVFGDLLFQLAFPLPPAVEEAARSVSPFGKHLLPIIYSGVCCASWLLTSLTTEPNPDEIAESIPRRLLYEHFRTFRSNISFLSPLRRLTLSFQRSDVANRDVLRRAGINDLPTETSLDSVDDIAPTYRTTIVTTVFLYYVFRVKDSETLASLCTQSEGWAVEIQSYHERTHPLVTQFNFPRDCSSTYKRNLRALGPLVDQVRGVIDHFLDLWASNPYSPPVYDDFADELRHWIPALDDTMSYHEILFDLTQFGLLAPPSDGFIANILHTIYPSLPGALFTSAREGYRFVTQDAVFATATSAPSLEVVSLAFQEVGDLLDQYLPGHLRIRWGPGSLVFGNHDLVYAFASLGLLFHASAHLESAKSPIMAE